MVFEEEGRLKRRFGAVPWNFEAEGNKATVGGRQGLELEMAGLEDSLLSGDFEGGAARCPVLDNGSPPGCKRR